MNLDIFVAILNFIGTVVAVVGTVVAVAAFVHPYSRKPHGDSGDVQERRDQPSADPAQLGSTQPGIRPATSAGPVVQGGAVFHIGGDLLVPQRAPHGVALVLAGTAEEDDQIVASADGRLLASLSGRSLVVDGLYAGRAIKRWTTSAHLELHPGARPLAVGMNGLAVRAILDEGAGSFAVVDVHSDGSSALVERREGVADAAAVVHTEPWILVDGHLDVPTSVAWRPPPDVIDFDVAGSVGDETVAVLHRLDGKPALTFVRSPHQAPVHYDFGEAIGTQVSGVSLARDPFNRPASVVAHLANGALAELPAMVGDASGTRLGGPGGT